MSEPFVGEIKMGGWSFAPRGYAFCNGQVLSIQQNTALFSLLGTTYGGNGQTTFALPDLRGRVPMHWGQGPGLTNRVQGELAGEEAVALIQTQMPVHTHIIGATNDDATAKRPGGNVLAATASPVYGTAVTTTMNPASVQTAGGGQPHDNMQPYLTVTFVIALEGIFPSRN